MRSSRNAPRRSSAHGVGRPRETRRHQVNRGRRAKSPEPEEAEKPYQGAQFSHLQGEWRDTVGIHSGTAKLIAAFIDRVFVTQYKMPAGAADAHRRAA
jgi:hypothetical protein